MIINDDQSERIFECPCYALHYFHVNKYRGASGRPVLKKEAGYGKSNTMTGLLVIKYNGW